MLGCCFWRYPRTGAAFIFLVSAWIFLTGLPVVRLTYGGVIFPLRYLQYQLTGSRAAASVVAIGQPLGQGNSWEQPFTKVGVWAVIREAERAGLTREEQALALAIARQESSFYFTAKNRSSSACGLYQFITATGTSQGLPWWACMDPVKNARAGARIMKRYRQVSGIRWFDFSKVVETERAARCYYLLHYYGLGNGCSRDREGIWRRVGPAVTRNTQRYYNALSVED